MTGIIEKWQQNDVLALSGVVDDMSPVDPCLDTNNLKGGYSSSSYAYLLCGFRFNWHLLYGWRLSRYRAPIHWLVHGQMTYNDKTVHQMPLAGNIAKTKASNGKQLGDMMSLESQHAFQNFYHL